jgi:thioredoxin-related protein
MKATHLFAALSAVTLTLGSAFGTAAEGWITDLDAAKKQAAAEKKDILIDFTGSDWCIWCKRLDGEVFSKDEFKKGVKDKFILVSLDYPQDKEKAGVTEEMAKKNAELAKTFAIKGYPTILLVDSEGKPFAATGYQEGGPDKYVTHLDELRGKKAARDEAFAKASKESGVAKAKDLVSVITTLGLEDEAFANSYGDVIGQIKEADPKDETGFGKKLASKEKMAAFGEKLQSFSATQDADGALAFVEETLKSSDFDKEQLQQISGIKIQIFASKGKFDEALKAVEETQKIDPDSEMSKQIEGFKAKLVQMKEQSAGKGEKEADSKKDGE